MGCSLESSVAEFRVTQAPSQEHSFESSTSESPGKDEIEEAWGQLVCWSPSDSRASSGKMDLERLSTQESPLDAPASRNCARRAGRSQETEGRPMEAQVSPFEEEPLFELAVLDDSSLKFRLSRLC